MNSILSALGSAESILLFAARVAVALIGTVVALRCFSSLRTGRRREDPVVVLEDMTTHEVIPVLYWENSIGRSRSCDIILDDATVSRAHAVLFRRESGWLVTDTNSKAGTFINGTKVRQNASVLPGDSIAMGSTALMLKRTADVSGLKPSKRPRRPAASPSSLMRAVTVAQLLLGGQACFAGAKPDVLPLIPLGILLLLEWGLYFFSIKVLGRVSFELETIAFFSSGVGILLLSGTGVKNTWVQLAALAAGIVLFCLMIWFLGDLDRAMRWRAAIGVLALLLFAANLVLGREYNGAKNWIELGPVTLQPSELVKIAFIFVGASTLDRLQTAQNLTGFIGFSAVCMGALFLMKDFGTACIFFVTFLIIAFMRSGSLRTIALICAVAGLGAFLILKFRPYVAQRFAVWGHVWEHAGDEGYQQTRVLSYSASGGLFGVGLGRGSLKSVFAAQSDLVFGMLCEELGLILALVVVLSIAGLLLYARSDATRSRSALYSISSCAAAGMLLFQTCLNIFGATDVLPLTGVTLPFVSMGGSSMVSVWGLLAFIKAGDERTYAARRRKRS
ncbi:FtsW/RodA/SpoVE family cell cycle protein [Caproicibacter sp. BJN0012]|uniref:FtsW/RodA/SpoVE family cell cycle protein n=1 Tax=Caproicibacter sp. BJN0012 TaxID=3110227 RepID=UPI002E1364E0|nr:FtsW/RodA/SpoVE family cell cycle protein [Caproicibacter sp. BJN0012]